MEERVTATIGFKAAPQVAPALDLVHRLILNQPLEHQRRRPPVDASQHEEPTVEPGSEEVHEVGIDASPFWVVAERRQELSPEIDERRRATRDHVESAKESLAAAIRPLSAAGSNSSGRFGPIRIHGLEHTVGVWRELVHEAVEERIDSGVVE